MSHMAVQEAEMLWQAPIRAIILGYVNGAKKENYIQFKGVVVVLFVLIVFVSLGIASIETGKLNKTKQR